MPFAPGNKMTGTRHGHGADLPVSPWIARFAPLIPQGGRVLDVAAGGLDWDAETGAAPLVVETT